MEDYQERETVGLPMPIPNADNLILVSGSPTLSLKLNEYDNTIGKSRVVTRSFNWLNELADAKDIYTFAEKIEELTDNEGLMDVIVTKATSINL